MVLIRPGDGGPSTRPATTPRAPGLGPTRRARGRAAVGLAVTLAVLGALAVPGDPAAAGDAPAGGDAAPTTRLVPLAPCRLLDSRVDGDVVAAGTIVEVRVAGRCGVPTDARAAAVTLTAVHAGAPGYVTAWGDGHRPEASNLNVDTGETIANSAIVPVGADGRIRVVTSAPAHLLVDVSGAFVPATTARAGRLVPQSPVRAHDTRDDGAALRPGETLTVDVSAGGSGEAAAVMATITVVDAARAGYVTAHAPGTAPPEASLLNLAAGETRATSTFVPVVDGHIAVTVDAGGHVLVDVHGHVTGRGGDASDEGLFVPLTPRRLHDSRTGRRTLGATATREVAVAEDLPSDPSRVAAVAVNLTATGVRDDGFWTAFPARTARPDTSTVNPTAGATTANATIVPVTEHGIAVYTATATDMIVDVAGYVTGEPAVATTGPAPDLIAPRRVLVVSDSAGAGMRWEGALGALRGAEYTVDLQSCRRLIAPSCNGREGVTPPNALAAVGSWPFGAHDTLVMAVGYNDPDSDFALAFETINAAARRTGIRTIVWVTLREQVDYEAPPSPSPGGWSPSGTTEAGEPSGYAAMNATMRAAADPARSEPGVPETGVPEIRVMDWARYSESAPSWLADDGVHLTRAGAFGFADMISRTIAALDAWPCPMPWRLGETRDAPCPDPAAALAERGAHPEVPALYETG